MDTFAPEFAQYWLTGQASDADAANPGGDQDSASQQAALVELAERVTAARSVV
jgi:hypothetical protein